MLKRIELRALAEKEQETLEKLIKSQTAPAIEVERAKKIRLVNAGEKVPAVSVKQNRSQSMIYRQIKRFNELGINSLVDETRSG